MSKKREVWLVCGGREYNNKPVVFRMLDRCLETYGKPSLVVHGAATGADTLASEWAQERGIQEKAVPADWDDLSHPDAIVRTNRRGKKYDAKAGLRRNEKMLDENEITRVIAFPGGKGTRDMAYRARRRGIGVTHIMPPMRDGKTLSSEERTQVWIDEAKDIDEETAKKLADMSKGRKK